MSNDVIEIYKIWRQHGRVDIEIFLRERVLYKGTHLQDKDWSLKTGHFWREQ